MGGRFLAGNAVVPGPAGSLEAIYKPGASERSRPAHTAVICHAHPLHGGTMHFNLIFRIARAFDELGYPTLRFNFRGVGGSEGTFDEGRGERDDVKAAIDWMAERHPDIPLVVAGFSFGSWTGLPVGCADPRVSHVVGLGVPVRVFSHTELNSCTKPKLLIQGTEDTFGPLAQLNSWYADLREPKRLVRIEGADHFFETKREEMAEAITNYFQEVG
ncbi:MAG TPA: alpha/beta fold hydrolase [Blastocatellia bacterium]|nr:alpha/beta fold hydrolase [Blastocatellia bacterium]